MSSNIDSKLKMNGRRVCIFDVDMTLADNSHRAKLAEEGRWDEFFDAMDKDTPIEQMDLFKFSVLDIDNFILTGRPEKYRLKTVKWLKKHFPEIRFDCIIMRPDGNFTRDTEFKTKKIKEIESNGYEIFAIFEDRKDNVDAFRKEGWFVFDVGNKPQCTLEKVGGHPY